MKLSKVFALTVMGGSTVGLAGYLVACGSDSPVVPPAAVGAPPAPPAANAPGLVPPTTKTATFAINSLLLGEADRGGAASGTAWKDYGYNIDGKVTTKTSTDVCTLAPNAGASVQVDGNRGIDNSFGSNILPIVQNAAGLTTPSKTVSDAIAKGGFTIMIKVVGLTDDPSACKTQTSNGLTGALFAGGKYDPDGGTVPAFDLTTDWPVRPELLADGKTIAGGSKVNFPNAYVNNGTFVNGVGATLTLSLAFGGVALDIQVNQATITFDHTAPANADNGTISGVIESAALIEGLKKVAGRISPSLCSGSTFDGIAAQINQASDIMKDGTNGPGQPCDGISIGLGFTAKQIKDPDQVAGNTAPSPDPCVDGG